MQKHFAIVLLWLRLVGISRVRLSLVMVRMPVMQCRKGRVQLPVAPEFTAFTMPHAFGQFSVAETNTDRNVEQWCADCARKAGHCQESR